MKKLSFLLSVSFVLFVFVSSIAQPAKQLVTVLVSPRPGRLQYKTGEQAEFKVTVYKMDYPLDNVILSYEVKPEKMETIKKGEVSPKKRDGNN